MAKAGPERTRGSNSCCGSLLRVLSAPPEPPPASIRLKGSCCGLRAREAAPGMLPLGRRQKVPFDPSRPWHGVTNPPLPLSNGHERNRTIATQKGGIHKFPAGAHTPRSSVGAAELCLHPLSAPLQTTISRILQHPREPLAPRKTSRVKPLTLKRSL